MIQPPSRTGGSLLLALVIAIRFHERNALAKRWSLSMERNYAEQGLLFSSREQRSAIDAFVCDQCSKAFASKRGLYMHSTHVHGYKPQVRFWATGSVCLKCSKEYHSRHRLMQHLCYSDACLLHLVDTFPPLSDEQVADLGQADRVFAAEQKALGRGPKKAHLPAIRVPGVSLPPIGSHASHKIRAACQPQDGHSTPWTKVAGRQASSIGDPSQSTIVSPLREKLHHPSRAHARPQTPTCQAHYLL